MEKVNDEWVLCDDKNHTKIGLDFLEIKTKINNLENEIGKRISCMETQFSIIEKQNNKIIKQNEHILEFLNNKTKEIDNEQIRTYNRNWRGSYLHGGLLPFAYNATP